MPTLRYVHVDVFTDTPLTGNQLAVFTDAREIEATTMQSLATEIGFSETTFVLPPEQGGHARMRIFNPWEEMRFAGHPTLGTVWVLGAPMQIGVVVLETLAGPIEVTLDRDPSGRIDFGRMLQPVPTIRDVDATDELFAALGVAGCGLPVELYDNGATHIFVAVESEEELAELRPDGARIAAFGVTGVNCFAGAGDRWTLRMFWPAGEDA